MVVYCTGYKITFPFFDEDFIAAPDNHIELFRRVFHPDIPNVFFIGLLQPLGAIMPLAEAQGAWVGDYLLGDYALPAQAEMRADIEADQAAMRARYVASKRHTIQVDYDDYLYALAKERAHGRRTGARKRVYPTGLMPTFCRHNRFIERCPICSKTLPGRAPGASCLAARQKPRRARAPAPAASPPRHARGEGVRVHREGRAEDDGYRSELVPGLRASADALRLVEEIAFSSGRLLALARRAARPLRRGAHARARATSSARRGCAS